MGKSITDLQFKDEALPQQDLADLPKFGRFTPPPPPGNYRFKLPKDLSQSFDLEDTDKGQRLKLEFTDEAPLTIISSANGQHIGEPFNTRLSGRERKRGKEGPEASDLDYLFKSQGVVARAKNLREQARTIQTFAGKEFSAAISYSWVCSDSRPIYVRKPADQGGQLEMVENQHGCGAKYYEKDVPKTNGATPYEITCGGCGASLRAFANLDNIRA